MDHNDTSLTIEELAERTQTPVRTVRYYIAERMLPGPGSRGKGATYTEEHLLRLRLIRRLAERHAPLAEIREVMARVTGDEVRALLAEEDRRTHKLDRATQAVSPRAYISALLDQARAPRLPQKPPTLTPPQQPASPQQPAWQPEVHALRMPPPEPAADAPARSAAKASAWRRVELAPGIELHIQTDAERRSHSLIERLLAASRDDSSDSHGSNDS
ncbi:MAG TPA: MerR family transcriptional regulator [Ktedonobacterales bacterium]|nr:MerR family transcriptional regulator [Ktedonobacterales bacterium]